MPAKGQKFTAADAAKLGYIAAAPISRVMNEWRDRQDEYYTTSNANVDLPEVGPIQKLAWRSGVSYDLLYRLMLGRKAWIEFDNADRIIMAIDSLLWLHDDELSEIYWNFDLSHLDRHRPTVEAAVAA